MLDTQFAFITAETYCEKLHSNTLQLQSMDGTLAQDDHQLILPRACSIHQHICESLRVKCTRVIPRIPELHEWLVRKIVAKMGTTFKRVPPFKGSLR